MFLLASFTLPIPHVENKWQKLPPKYTDFYLFCIFRFTDLRVTTLFVLAVVAVLGNNPASPSVIRLGLLRE
jgi:hypothetical protein